MLRLKYAVRRVAGYPSHDAKYRSLPTLEIATPIPQKDCAVIIHLYYLDNWPLFKNKLDTLRNYIDFDLYITKTIGNDKVDEVVLVDYPDAIIAGYPNRGRDVLPFINISKQIKDKYTYFLKFHSKKSTHWDGGQKWLEETLNKLIPMDESAAASLVKVLIDKSTGIVGPSDYYYPLTINFPANGPHISRVIRYQYSAKTEYEVAQLNRSQFGFFGGTMFWGRFDAIDSLIQYANYRRFEPEAGQIDGTFAHALERLFCVVPEIDGKNMYEYDGLIVSERPYASDNIPSWSTVHDR